MYQEIVNLLTNVEDNLEQFEKDAFHEIGRYADKAKEKNDIFEIILLRRKLLIQLFNYICVLYKAKRLIKRIADAQKKQEPVEK